MIQQTTEARTLDQQVGILGEFLYWLKDSGRSIEGLREGETPKNLIDGFLGLDDSRRERIRMLRSLKDADDPVDTTVDQPYGIEMAGPDIVELYTLLDVETDATLGGVAQMGERSDRWRITTRCPMGQHASATVHGLVKAAEVARLMAGASLFAEGVMLFARNRQRSAEDMALMPMPDMDAGWYGLVEYRKPASDVPAVLLTPEDALLLRRPGRPDAVVTVGGGRPAVVLFGKGLYLQTRKGAEQGDE